MGAIGKGMQGQTLSVVINGTHLTGATLVTLGTGITVNGFNIDSDTQITANVTIGNKTAVGLSDVSITNLSGTATIAKRFRILANTLSVQ